MPESMPQWMQDYDFPPSRGTAIECGRLYRQLGYSADEAREDFRVKRNAGVGILQVVAILKEKLEESKPWMQQY